MVQGSNGDVAEQCMLLILSPSWIPMHDLMLCLSIDKVPCYRVAAGNAALCGRLCYELLRCCNSRLSTIRQESCAILYLLMRSNFEFSSHKGLTRVHLQVREVYRRPFDFESRPVLLWQQCCSQLWAWLLLLACSICHKLCITMCENIF